LTTNYLFKGELIGSQSIKYYRLDTNAEQLCHHITIEVEVYHGFASVVVATGRYQDQQFDTLTLHPE